MSATKTHTATRRINLAKITSGAVSTIPKITHMAFGDGGYNHDTGQIIPPDGNATALNHEVGRYIIESVTYPLSTTVRYVVTIPENELAGTAISEIGLLDENGDLCAIQNTLPKYKDNGILFIITVDDEF